MALNFINVHRHGFELFVYFFVFVILLFLCQALQSAIKNLTTSIKKRKDKIVAMQTALELDSEVSIRHKDKLSPYSDQHIISPHNITE